MLPIHRRPKSLRADRGFTILEVLISLAVFSICIIGLARAQQSNVQLSNRAEKKERALIVAQDLYEEMMSVPFIGSGSSAPGYARPSRLGSVLAYNGLVDSPVQNVVDQEVPWGRELARLVSIRQFTPEDRTNLLPPLTPPIGEYAECKIEVRDIASDEVLTQLEFVRAL